MVAFFEEVCEVKNAMIKPKKLFCSDLLILFIMSLCLDDNSVFCNQTSDLDWLKKKNRE